MNGFAKICLTVALLSAVASATDNQLMESTNADKDVPLTTNSGASFWQGGRSVYAEQDTYGRPVPRHRTEIRSRWTRGKSAQYPRPGRERPRGNRYRHPRRE